MGSKSASWENQWGKKTDDDDKDKLMAKVGNGLGPLVRMKSAASSGKDKAKAAAAATSSGFDKAKEAATSGAETVKSSALTVKSKTSNGFKWIKNQYSKKFSK